MGIEYQKWEKYYERFYLKLPILIGVDVNLSGTY
jgi:hypothetical protein